MNEILNINITKAHLTKTSRTHALVEASDIGMRPGKVADTITLINPDNRPGRFVFKFSGTKRDNEGDVEEWSYRYTNQHGVSFGLTVMND